MLDPVDDTAQSIEVFSLSRSKDALEFSTISQIEIGSIGQTPSLLDGRQAEESELNLKLNISLDIPKQMNAEVDFCSFPQSTVIPDSNVSELIVKSTAETALIPYGPLEAVTDESDLFNNTDQSKAEVAAKINLHYSDSECSSNEDEIPDKCAMERLNEVQNRPEKVSTTSISMQEIIKQNDEFSEPILELGYIGTDTQPVPSQLCMFPVDDIEFKILNSNLEKMKSSSDSVNISEIQACTNEINQEKSIEVSAVVEIPVVTVEHERFSQEIIDETIPSIQSVIFPLPNDGDQIVEDIQSNLETDLSASLEATAPTVIRNENDRIEESLSAGNDFVPNECSSDCSDDIVDMAVSNEDGSMVKLVPSGSPELVDVAFKPVKRPRKWQSSPITKKAKIEKAANHSSSESDNSQDEDYHPTQMVLLHDENLEQPKSRKQKNPPFVTPTRLLWKKVRKSQFYEAKIVASSKKQSGFPDVLQPGQIYLERESERPIVVKQILQNKRVLVIDSDNLEEELDVSDLLLPSDKRKLPKSISFDLGQSAQKKSTANQTNVESMTFEGYSFIVSLTFSGTENTNPNKEDREYVENMILQHKGRILDSIPTDFNSFQKKRLSDREIILLAHKPLRTRKYLQALGLGIPIISAIWLKKCVEKDSLLDYEPFRLSNGESLLLDQFIAPRPNKNGVFHTQRVLVMDISLKQDWEAIVKSAGAKIIRNSKEIKNGDFVLVDKLAQPKDLAKVKAANVVTVEFIIQCLIHQCLLKPSDHPRFHFG